jgi:hypothetical protein
MKKELIKFLYWCLKNKIDLSFTDDCPESVAERYIEELTTRKFFNKLK